VQTAGVFLCRDQDSSWGLVRGKKVSAWEVFVVGRRGRGSVRGLDSEQRRETVVKKLGLDVKKKDTSN
jgi:hypothetical protein